MPLRGRSDATFRAQTGWLVESEERRVERREGNLNARARKSEMEKGIHANAPDASVLIAVGMLSTARVWSSTER